MKLPNIIFETLPVGPLAVNCYIIGSKKDHNAVVIDAGGDHEEILKTLKKHNLILQFILNTHAHFDHVGGVRPLQDLTKAKFLLHREDCVLLDYLNDQTEAFGLPAIPIPKVDKPLVDNEVILIGNETIRVIHTPGHSPGSICFLIDNVVFTGDTLFAGSIGRTDLYGGSYHELISSIKIRLFTLEDHFIVYPGHGTFTTIGEEKRHNPFFYD
ncbi:MAG: MBL fold metallo-hydrolase [Candidatus Brocadia sp. WS118]|nr:MAG: MBL fold metallo-hydrolase [Candidatus Brocadia sp. WS118]